MPQSLARIWLHIVFSTKDRQPLFEDDKLRQEMFKMLGHYCGEVDCPSARVGGWHDHVHVLCSLARTITVAKLVEAVKVETSKWAKDRSHVWKDFHWQAGYGVFSVSQSAVPQVIGYLDDQPQHHGRMGYQDEFRGLCLKHELPIDERYVWD